MNDLDLTYPKIDQMYARGECHITGRFLRQIVRGEREPGLKKLDAIADLFGVLAHSLIIDPNELGNADFFHDSKLKNLISNYLEADDEGKDKITQAAKNTLRKPKQREG